MGETEPFDHHGAQLLRGLAGVPRSSTDQGRFGRLFRTLPPLASTDADLQTLALGMADPPGTDPTAGDNPAIPSGYTYFGQFVDHDITFDPVSSLDRANDPDALENFRTPRYDLDCLYGSGRAQHPFLYDAEDPHKLLVGRNTDPLHEVVDLPRNDQGRALIGDPRNDIHVILSQLHLGFIRFHNAVVDHLRSGFFPEPELTAESRRLVCWHYQWVVVHDFLRRLVGPDVLADVMGPPMQPGAPPRLDLRFYSWRRKPWMPVEFSAAAYRFGHSMVRGRYRLNPTLEPLAMFSSAPTPNPLQQLGGFRPLPKGWTVDWRLFFDIDTDGDVDGGGTAPQPSRRIDTRLAQPLHRLPENVDKPRRSLALLNLMRGRALLLPSGQAVAQAMGTAVDNADLGLSGEVPLWYYLLRESEVVAEGLRLGPTGGRIVAEVLIGLLKGDPSSYLRLAPAWKPELPSTVAGQFTLPDLLRFAGVV